MCPPLHHYACAGGGRILGFWGRRVDLSPSDVVMSWLRLKPPPWSAFHIHMICIQNKVFQHLDMLGIDICVHPYTVMLVQVWGGVYFWDFGVDLSPRDVEMPWLRLKSPVKCIPYRNDMYTKCFKTLICCEWT